MGICAKKGRKDTNKQLKLLGQSAILEEAKTPYLIRWSMLVVCLAVLTFIVWTSVSRIKEVARTVGEIIPSGHVQVIQHLEGGIVGSIDVADDQIVKKGQVLMTISGEAINSEQERISTRQRILKERRDRLRAYLSTTEVENKEQKEETVSVVDGQRQILEGMLQSDRMEAFVIKEQIVQKNEQIDLLKQERSTENKNLEIAEASFETQKELYNERLVPEHMYLNALQEKNARSGRLAAIEIEIRKAQQAVMEYQWRLKAIGSNSREDALRKIGMLESEISENSSIIKRLIKQADRLVLRSPVNGVVKGLEVHTIGGVIAPGQRLLEIVPLENELIAEVKIMPVDVGHIKIGDPVNVKVTSYDASRYGSIAGTVTGISATTFAGISGTPYYKGRIRLSKTFVGEVQGKKQHPAGE